MTRRSLVLVAVLTFAMGLLVSGVTFSAQPSGPIRGGTLRVQMVSDPPSFDSHTSTTARIHIHTAAVFNGLVRTNPMKEQVTVENVIPDLAQSWKI
ncbi:MAG TPA: hypothetical protein VMT62_01770, partial [Syntrophorhabdaceae bacterium]|nr:hypothetical protein [Syntrophorhabdaceae bacterium]